MYNHNPREPLPCQLSGFVQHYAKRAPQSIAILTPEDQWTYQALDQQVARYTAGLVEYGIRSGDRLALIMADERTLLTAILAAARLAAPVMLVPRSSTPVQRNEWMRLAGIRFVLTDRGTELQTQFPQKLIDARGLAHAQPASADTFHPADNVVTPNTILMIVVGSGTTGRQKLMPITHAQMTARVQCLSDNLGITPQDRLGSLSHLEYVGGVHRLFTALRCGAGFVCLDKARHQWRAWHQQYGLTVLSSTAFHAHQMLQEVRESEPQTTRPLEGIQLTVSSSVVSQNLRKSILSELCADLKVNYGTNESWTATVAEGNALLQHAGTVGRPLPGVKVRIVDESMRSLPTGLPGLIAIQSDQLISGYLNDDEATQRALIDGWFIPGDVGRFTPDGHLIYCGRSDNMMIFNGINIFPIEIEQCLLNHPDVADVVAMPTRHALHQDLPIAIVVLHKNAKATEQQLSRFAAKFLGPKQPRRILLVDDIPRNQQGKPSKKELNLVVAHAMSKLN